MFAAPATEFACLHGVRLMDGLLLRRLITELRGSTEGEITVAGHSADRA